ncbi:flavodoxin family protein [Halonatronum saccharophilum]|uniref:flavodoxin family protein n=1 Tax=Halonatronum saccharophilum TaxID=150060 RepID=UPI000485722B|nr:flavodoxin domain-containing protein [Halonatronum saccharophilum]
MEKAIIIYDSLFEGTIRLAKLLGAVLTSTYDVLRVDIKDVNLDKLEDFDLIILGSSPREDEGSDDFVRFYNSLAEVDIDLSKKRGAAFCPINKNGPTFCESVDILEEELKDMGMKVGVKGFKFDGDDEALIAKFEEWISGL